MSREDHIREFAAAALSEGRCDYFIGWKQGHNSSEVIPAFVKEAADVEQLIWNPLCQHNLVTFLKRNMPDPPGAKIGVCVKGCDSRTLVALLQEGLVDKEKLYVVGVPCDGLVDRRKLEKMFADEIVDIAFPERGKVVVTTRQGETKGFAQNDVLLAACSRCRYPNAIYSDDTAGPLEREPERDLVPPDWSDLEDYENLSDDQKQALLEKIYSTCVRCFACINVCPVCYCWDKCVNRSRQPELVSAEGGAQGEPALPDGAHVPRGRPLPVVRRLRPGLSGGDPACAAASEDEQGDIRDVRFRAGRQARREAGVPDVQPQRRLRRLKGGTMAIKYLKADQLPAFLAALAEKARVVAPIKSDGVVQFEPWEPGKEVELDVLLAKQSPKEWVFLQTETFLKFGYGMAAMRRKAPAGEGGHPPRDGGGGGAERGACPGHLRPAALRRPRLRPDGQRVRRLRRLLLRPALQRAA